ncbi:MAG: transcription antitermination protein NusB [Clostridia bacterium]|nr:transcription antitermination protein NusB [Clostridia bacterium]
MRSLAREAVFKFIYSKLFNPDDEGLFDVLIKDLNTEDKIFATQLKDFVEKEQDKYYLTISNLSIGYKFDRVYKADRCALLIGMAEFDNFKDTPKIVIIDEAVKLSAKYSTENSPDFVNGVLAKYIGE